MLFNINPRHASKLEILQPGDVDQSHVVQYHETVWEKSTLKNTEIRLKS